MIQLKLTWRNIWRNKSFSLINITGLAIGIAAALLLFIVVKYELSYDTFQKNYNHIYRVVTIDKFEDGITYNSGIPVPALDALRIKFPQATFGAVYSMFGSQVTVPVPSGNEKRIIEKDGILFADPGFFAVLNFTWISGSPEVLAQPGSVVLSQSTAEKYFGKDILPIGRVIKLDNQLTLKVSGIIRDQPANSDFPLKVIASMETVKRYPELYNYNDDWGNTSSNYQVYTLLPSGQSPEFINKQLISFAEEHYKRRKGEELGKINFLQPLPEIHFDNRFDTFGDHRTGKATLWTLSLIAVFILIMACINFINLSTAQSITRSKEIGIRKVLGSSRAKLFWQIMGETGLLVSVSVILAILIARLSVPYVKNIVSLQEDIQLFSVTNMLLLFLIGLLVTFLAGIYPSVKISGFNPIAALKNKVVLVKAGGISLRRGLVVLQFSISQMLIAGTIVAVSQMNFIRESDLGFNKDAVLMLKLNTDSVSSSKQYAFGEAIKRIPGVTNISFTADPPASDNNWSTNFAFDHRPDEKFQMHLKFADTAYLNTFGLQLIAGENYQPGDTSKDGLINETMLHMLGLQNADEAVGKSFRLGRGNWLKIAGVVKDFKASSFRSEVKPMFILPYKRVYGRAGLKLHSTNLAKTQAEVEKVYNTHFPEYAYNSTFLDDAINEFYQQDDQLTLLYKIFAGLAVFIACLGVYGLVSFMAVQKTKEVGIRKVLGASVSSIVYMFSKEFTILIIISFFIAFPAAWYFMTGWLNDFHYRISLNAIFFIGALLISLGIAWLSVAYKAIAAAVSNPVKALRTE